MVFHTRNNLIIIEINKTVTKNRSAWKIRLGYEGYGWRDGVSEIFGTGEQLSDHFKISTPGLFILLFERSVA